MKAMPLPFEEFQGKGFPLDFSSTSSSSSSDSPLLLFTQQQKWSHTIPNANANTQKEKNCYVGSEPTSVLDTRRSPSPPTSSSTTLGGGPHSTDTVAAAVSDTTPNPSPTAALEEEHLRQLSYQKCGGGVGGALEDWESVLSESSPGQEQSILRLIMSDVDDEDPSIGLNRLLQQTTGSQGMEFNAGFGVVDDDAQVGYSSFDEFNRLIGSASANPNPNSTNNDFNNINNNNNNCSSNNPMFSNNLLPVSFSPVIFQQQQLVESLEAKPHNFSPQMVMSQSHASFVQNQGLVMPLTYTQLQQQQQQHHHHQLISTSPPAKRLNTGGGGSSFHVQKGVASAAAAQFQYSVEQQQQQQFQLLSQQRPNAIGLKPKSGIGDEQWAMVQQAIADQLSKAAELIETGNLVLAQGILARLNHQLSPHGKPLHRAAFYFKEALQLLVGSNSLPTSSIHSSPFNLIFKVGAYKTFSEISPVLQFANFTCNQAILEATKGFTRIHVVDFDIGYGGQWASLMQELALGNNNNGGNGNGMIVSLKITAFASPATHEEFELSFTLENLKQFAAEINLGFEIEILSLEAINSASMPVNLHVSDNEAIAVNLPIGSFVNNPMLLPLALCFSKQLSPKILVSLERACDRTDTQFPVQIIHALSSYTALLESLDAVNINLEAMQKIERCLIQPGIEKIVLSRRGRLSPERALPQWRALFSSSGFSPAGFSNFAESQAECLVQRTPVREGFHVEKRQSSLVLCWQRKELAAVSAWRC